MKIIDFGGPKPSKMDPKELTKMKKILQESGQQVNNEQRRPNVRSKSVPEEQLGGQKTNEGHWSFAKGSNIWGPEAP